MLVRETVINSKKLVNKCETVFESEKTYPAKKKSRPQGDQFKFTATLRRPARGEWAPTSSD